MRFKFLATLLYATFVVAPFCLLLFFCLYAGLFPNFIVSIIVIMMMITIIILLLSLLSLLTLFTLILQCFDAVGWAAGRASGM